MENVKGNSTKSASFQLVAPYGNTKAVIDFRLAGGVDGAKEKLMTFGAQNQPPCPRVATSSARNAC